MPPHRVFCGAAGVERGGAALRVLGMFQSGKNPGSPRAHSIRGPIWIHYALTNFSYPTSFVLCAGVARGRAALHVLGMRCPRARHVRRERRQVMSPWTLAERANGLRALEGDVLPVRR